MAIYLKGKDLREEMLRCQDASLAYSDKLIEMFTLIAENYSHKYTYKYPEDKDDCKQQAVVDCNMYWHNFNVEKSSNAFAYITQIVKNGYQKAWRKIHQDIKETQKLRIESKWNHF